MASASSHRRYVTAFEVKPLFAIDRAGYAVRDHHRSTRPVWESRIMASITEIGVDLTSLPVPGFRIPMVMKANGPAGAKAEHWVLGGTQAASVTFSQIAGRVAFGFQGEKEFEQWVRWAGDFGNEDPVWFRTGFGETRDVGPTRTRHSALQLAYHIIGGHELDARAALGIGAQPTTKSESGHANDAQMLLARAIGIIALSRHPFDKRQAAARVLALVGHRQAERVARFLVRQNPKLFEMKLLRQGRARKRIDRARTDPTMAMTFVGEVLAALLAIFGKAVV